MSVYLSFSYIWTDSLLRGFILWLLANADLLICKMKKCYLQKQTRNQLLLLDVFCTQTVLDSLKPRGNYPKKCWHIGMDFISLWIMLCIQENMGSFYWRSYSFFPYKVKSRTGKQASSVQLHRFTWNFCRAPADLHGLPKHTQVSIDIDIGVLISNSQLNQFSSTHDVSFTVFS